MSSNITLPTGQERKFLTGLAGRNILASRSPWMHQCEADAQGVRLIYALFDFNALHLDDADLPRILDAAQLLGFAGLNITFPFKQAVIPLLDALAPGAEKLGAVNTVAFQNGKRIGHNTDVLGFAENMKICLPNAALGHVVQFGAGGAGSATAYALLTMGAGKISLFDADTRRCDILLNKLRAEFGAARIGDGESVETALAGADGIVNATPMGMVTHPGMPFDPGLLSPRHWVSDIVYFPLETELLRQARLRGCATVDGGGMSALQAAAGFDIFTGLNADRARMLKSFAAFTGAANNRAA